MSVTEAEQKSALELVDESKETEEICKKLHAIIKRPGSVDKMKAIRVDANGKLVQTIPPPPSNNQAE
jgi:hypothetical protein